MKDWHGTVYHNIDDPQARNAVAEISDFLFQLSPSIGRITKGQVPNSSGLPLSSVIDLTDYFYWGKPIHKGAYDFANGLLGIGTLSPTARLHAHSDIASQYSIPKTDTLVQIGWSASPSGTVASCIDDITDGNDAIQTDSDFARFTTGLGGNTYNGTISSGLTNPGSALTAKLRFRARTSIASATDAGVNISLANNPGATIVTKKMGTSGATGPVADAVLGASFATFEFSLSAAALALIDFTKQPFILAFDYSGVGGSVGTIDISWVQFVVSGAGTQVLQVWSLTSGTAAQVDATGKLVLNNGLQITTGAALNSIPVSDASGNLTLTATTAITLSVKDTLFTIVDDGDTSKKIAFQCSGISTATTRTWTSQDQSGTVAYIDAAQVFTATQTFNDSQLRVRNVTTTTKQLALDCSQIAPATTRTVTFTNTSGNNVLDNNVLVDSDGNVVTDGADLVLAA